MYAKANAMGIAAILVDKKQEAEFNYSFDSPLRGAQFAINQKLK